MIHNGFRLDYQACRTHLEERLAEPAPGRVQLLTGPRQVGKTTLLLDLARQYGDPAVYAACDGPEAGLPGFWERLWETAQDRTRQYKKAFLFLDEVQHVARWSMRSRGSGTVSGVEGYRSTSSQPAPLRCGSGPGHERV